ncbi:MAG TPA: MCE family protein [Acidimicrobiales bacterium]|jgi:phospholipid/cholesterol/gamma-HCH transport system substrate-binding protein|nr:MCE family protein [Acidimicrobiales bacterium]
MITRRIITNLIAFFVIAAVLIVFGLINLLGNPFQTTTPVSALLPNAYGIYSNFSVTLNGVQVGTVRSVSLTPTGAKVDMAINPGVKVPGDVAAEIEIANTLGEQQIDLVPQRGGTAPPLKAGAQIPVAPGGAPADIGQVIATATQFLAAIPVDNLNTLLHETATALNGNAANVHTIITSGTQFAQEFLAFQQAFKSLLASAPPVLDTVTASSPQLTSALANTAALLNVLTVQQSNFLSLLDTGASSTQLLNQLVVAERPNLACVVHDLGAATTNLSQPANLNNLATDLANNQEFFGAVEGLSVTGPARQLTASEPARTNQEYLRTRLILPPVLSPAAQTYPTPKSVPPISPAAGCSTEFGNGVGAASQPGFTPAAPVAIDTASAADSQVHGGGTPIAGAPLTTSSAAAVRTPSPSPSTPFTVLPLMGAAVLLQHPVRRRLRNRRHRQETEE